MNLGLEPERTRQLQFILTDDKIEWRKCINIWPMAPLYKLRSREQKILLKTAPLNPKLKCKLIWHHWYTPSILMLAWRRPVKFFFFFLHLIKNGACYPGYWWSETKLEEIKPSSWVLKFGLSNSSVLSGITVSRDTGFCVYYNNKGFNEREHNGKTGLKLEAAAAKCPFLLLLAFYNAIK